MSKITITVSGPVGAGKTTLCAKLQILLKHLGCDVQWKDGAAEANMGIEEWPNEFKTPIELVEKVIPHVSVYEVYKEYSDSTDEGWKEVSRQDYYRLSKELPHRMTQVPVEEPEVTQNQIQELALKHSEWTPQGFAIVDSHRYKFAEELVALVQGKEVDLTAQNISQEPEVIPSTSTAYTPVGYMMKHRCGPDRGFSWNKNDLQFSEDWIRVGLVTEETLELQLQQAARDYNERAKRWRDTFDSMHRRAMRAEAKITELSAFRADTPSPEAATDARLPEEVFRKIKIDEVTYVQTVNLFKPCPFCGGNATPQKCHTDEGKPYFVSCDGCHIEVAYAATEDEALKKWNTRYNEKE